LKARFTEVQGKLKEARKALRGSGSKELEEAPLNQVVAPVAPGGQPQQQPPAAQQSAGAPAGTPQQAQAQPAKMPTTPQEKVAAATGAAAALSAQPGGVQKVAAGLKLDPTTMMPKA
jgi:hypothetical protein